MKLLSWPVMAVGVMLVFAGPVLTWIAWMHEWATLEVLALFVSFFLPHDLVRSETEVAKGYILACSWIPGFLVIGAGYMLRGDDETKTPETAAQAAPEASAVTAPPPAAASKSDS